MNDILSEIVQSDSYKILQLCSKCTLSNAYTSFPQELFKWLTATYDKLKHSENRHNKMPVKESLEVMDIFSNNVLTDKYISV